MELRSGRALLTGASRGLGATIADTLAATASPLEPLAERPAQS
jgi:short-subunit dehydrogenase